MGLQDLANIYGLWGRPDLAGNNTFLQWLLASGNDAQVAQATNGWDPTSWAMHAAETGADPNMIGDWLGAWPNQMPAGWQVPGTGPQGGDQAPPPDGGGGATTPPPSAPPPTSGTGGTVAPPPAPVSGGGGLPGPNNPPSNPAFPLGPPPTPVPYNPPPAPTFNPGNPYTAPVIQAPTPFSYAPPPTVPNFQLPSMDEILKDPSYQFRVSQGLNTLQNSAAAKGVLNDSGTAKSIIDYGQNAASQEIGNVYNRDLGIWQANAGNTLNNWLTGYNAAADTWGRNFGATKDVYDRTLSAGQDQYKTNYQTQVTDPYNANLGIWNTTLGIGQKNTDTFNQAQTGNYNNLLGQWSDYLDRLYKQQQLGLGATTSA